MPVTGGHCLLQEDTTFKKEYRENNSGIKASPKVFSTSRLLEK
jgi:hypothetical protein